MRLLAALDIDSKHQSGPYILIDRPQSIASVRKTLGIYGVHFLIVIDSNMLPNASSTSLGLKSNIILVPYASSYTRCD